MSYTRIAILILSLLVAPAFVYAETDASVEGSASVNAEVKERPPLLPKILPAIKDAAQTTRENVKAVASTTRMEVKTRVEAGAENIRALIGERKEEARAEMEEKREELQARAEAAKEKAAERWSAAIQNHVRVIVERLTAAIDRLDTLAARTEDRIEKLQAEGYAMTESVALMTEARADIRVASDDVAAVSVAIEAALSSETPKEKMADVRAAIKKAVESIKVAKDSLMEVLKSIRVEASAETTTTSDVQ